MEDPKASASSSSSSAKRSAKEELEYLLEQITTLSSHLEATVFYKMPMCKPDESHSMEDNIRELSSHLNKLISLEAHIQLAKLTARVLFEDTTFMIAPTKKSSRGAVVVVVDALTRRLWVSENVLAKSLKLDSEFLPRVLDFLESKYIVRRFSKLGQMYCSLAYDRIPVVMNYKHLKIVGKLDKDIESANAAKALYLCENCNKEYTSLDAPSLIDLELGDKFYCPNCRIPVVVISTRLALESTNTLQRLKDQMKPITMLLEKIIGLPVPKIGTEPALQDIYTENDASAETRITELSTSRHFLVRDRS